MADKKADKEIVERSRRSINTLEAQYKTSPLPLLDVIVRKGSATARTITDTLGYAPRSSKHQNALSALKRLYDDGFLRRIGRGGRYQPYKYALNRRHPQAYLLKAMCQPDEVLESVCKNAEK